MGLVTLLSDYNSKDFYLAKIKIRANRLYPEYTILDISHGIDAFNLKETSYAFNSMLDDFTSEDIHFIFVDIHYDRNYEILAVETEENGIIFLPNNGLLGLLKIKTKNCYSFGELKDSFIELILLEKVAELNDDFSSLAKKESPYLLRAVKPKVTDSEIRGEIIYIDSYGNCITNICQEEFDSFTNGINYHIKFRRNIIERISKDYSDAREAAPVVFINQQGYLEISSIQGNASTLFGLNYESSISVKKS